MGLNRLKVAIVELEKQGKDVVAIDNKLVLCYWAQDNSYVSWRWYLSDKLEVHCENGEYMQANLTTLDQAVKAYYERGLR